jgi:hypothetical protein
VTAARSVLADMVLARVKEAIDINELLMLEGDLEDAIERASDQGDAGLDAAELLDQAWQRATEQWRQMRALEKQPLVAPGDEDGDDDDDGDDGECALCANPPPGLHFEMDGSGELRQVDPRTLGHRHRS